MFIYYGIDNYPIKDNGNPDINNRENYFSIKDINDSIYNIFLFKFKVDIGEELKGEPKLDRLLELLMIVKRKFEFFELIKKINNYISTKEFKEEKLILFKELLYKRVEEFSEKIELNDKILLPYIFNVLKKAFFKIRSSNGGMSTKYNQKRNSIRKTSDANLNKNKILELENNQEKNSALIVKYFVISFLFLRVDIQEDISLSALNYIVKHLEENVQVVIDGKMTNTDEYFFDYIVTNKCYIKFCDMILKYYEYQACVQPVFGLLARIIKTKKSQTQELVEYFNTDKFMEIIKKIIRIHDCNSLVMASLFTILYYIIDQVDIENILYIVSFQRLREIFNIFKMNGFDIIHESILHLVKAIILKKTADQRFKKNSTVNLLGINNSTLLANTSILDGKNINMDSSILISTQNTETSEEEYIEAISIFANALLFLRNKIILMDSDRISRWLCNLFTHMYTISNLINNFKSTLLQKLANSIYEKKVSELMVECLAVLHDKKIFSHIDNFFNNDVLDFNLINIKIMIFRTLYHCLALIKSIKDIMPNSIPKYTAEKLVRIMKTIEDNDQRYNPGELYKIIEKHSKNKIDQYTQNLLLLHRNLQDYYNRYKSCKTEHFKELMIIVTKK